MNNKIIVIDLGTNTAIFSVVEIVNNALIISYEKSITTRIGQNISRDNLIIEEALDRNLEMLSSELNKLRTLYNPGKIYGMTTEAIRNARNGYECMEKINKKLDIKFDIISGKEEALYTWQAVKHLVKDKNLETAVCDIGGGSTEIALVKDDKVIFSQSLPLGVVRLEEELHLTSNNKNFMAALNKIKKFFEFPKHKTSVLFLSGGTATTMASIMLGLDDYDQTSVEGVKIHKKDIDGLLEKLFASSLAEIKTILKADPGRADVITAGVSVIKVLLETLNPKETIITTYGPRHGYIMSKMSLKDVNSIEYKLE